MTTVALLVEGIGPPVLSLHAAPRGAGVRIGGIAVHDPADPTPCGVDDLVVLIGTTPGSLPLALARELAACGAAAVLLKAPAEIAPATLDAAEASGLALLSVPAGSSWSRVLTWLRSAVTRDDLAQADSAFGGITGGDLFGLANSIATVMDGPVTIEDPQLRVLAFSSRQESADRARLGSILGRQTPEPFLGRLRERGVLRRLYGSTRPIYVRGLPPDVLPRMAIAVRAGSEILGSIWVVVPQRPARARMNVLEDAAGVAALHLLRHRLSGDARRELQTELVASVLSGGPLAAEAARRLGIEGRHHVVAVGIGGAGDERTAALGRVWELLQHHLGAVHRTAPSALLDGTAYAIVPTQARNPERSAVRPMMEQFVRHAEGVLKLTPRVGVGQPAAAVEEIPRSRQQADRSLHVLLTDGLAARVAGVEDTWALSILDRLEDLCPHEVEAGRRLIARLRDHDRTHGSKLTQTLAAWLRHFGDTAGVARELGVHVNTVRFRMRTLRDEHLVALGDPDERLGLTLIFRLERLAAANGRAAGSAGAIRGGPKRRSTVVGRPVAPV